jgi:hypothetical protein
MEIDYKSVAKNPRKKTSQQVSKSAQISGDNPVENIQNQGIIQYRRPPAQSLPSNPRLDRLLNRFDADRLRARVKIATAAQTKRATRSG